MNRTLSAIVLCAGVCVWAAWLPAADDDEPPIRRAEEVIEIFQTNQAAVDEDYLDKKIHVTGEVLRITRATSTSAPDAKGEPQGDPEYIVYVASGRPVTHYRPINIPPGGYVPASYPASAGGADRTDAPGHLEFRFTAKHRAQLAELRTGRSVTFEAVCKGEHGNAGARAIRFDSSKVIKVHESPRPTSPYAPEAGPRPPSYSPSGLDAGPGVPTVPMAFPPSPAPLAPPRF